MRVNIEDRNVFAVAGAWGAGLKMNDEFKNERMLQMQEWRVCGQQFDAASRFRV
jgi:hypothetical protein